MSAYKNTLGPDDHEMFMELGPPSKASSELVPASGSAPIEVHIPGWQGMPKETQNALLKMFTIISERIQRGEPPHGLPARKDGVLIELDSKVWVAMEGFPWPYTRAVEITVQSICSGNAFPQSYEGAYTVSGSTVEGDSWEGGNWDCYQTKSEVPCVDE